MKCKKFSHINSDGEKVYVNKHKFATHDEAVEVAKKMNARDKQITKLVTYKCSECHNYHIGRNGKTITKKYRDKLKW